MKTKHAIMRAGGRAELAHLLNVEVSTTYSQSWRSDLPPKHERYLRLARPTWFNHSRPLPPRVADLMPADPKLPLKAARAIELAGSREALARLCEVETITTYRWTSDGARVVPPKHDRFLRVVRPQWYTPDAEEPAQEPSELAMPGGA